jgi:hypothetical protein
MVFKPSRSLLFKMGVAPSTPSYPASAYTLVQTVSYQLEHTFLHFEIRRDFWGNLATSSDYYSLIQPTSSVNLISSRAPIQLKDLSTM